VGASKSSVYAYLKSVKENDVWLFYFLP
jgi:hypothetical protein